MEFFVGKKVVIQNYHLHRDMREDPNTHLFSVCEVVELHYDGDHGHDLVGLKINPRGVWWVYRSACRDLPSPLEQQVLDYVKREIA